MGETCKVVALSDDGDSAEVCSGIGGDIELREGICSGILKTGGMVDDGMGICIESVVIDSGKHVAS